MTHVQKNKGQSLLGLKDKMETNKRMDRQTRPIAVPTNEVGNNRARQ